MATKIARIKAATGMLQLHIELKHLRPKVWRRVLVPETITLAKLHQIIQALFQWSGAHLHEFNAGEERYGSPDPDFDLPGSIGSERTKLLNALTPSRTIDYVYDFGDSWDHRVKVEKVFPPSGLKLPMCMGGANATPPDDCGGVPGYADLVQAMADPDHPEHDEMKVWIGGGWDPAEFDIDKVNRRLAAIKL